MTFSSDLRYSFEFCEGLRTGSRLIYIPDTKHLYKLKVNSILIKRYVCYNKSCTASAVIDMKNQNFVRIPKNSAKHCHSDNENLRKKMRDINEIKNKCKNTSFTRHSLRDVFNEVCTKYTENSSQVQFVTLRRSLSRIRNSSLPRAPVNARELSDLFKADSIMSQFGLSRYINEPFYRSTIIEENFSYSVFISPSIANEIEKLQNNFPRNYLLDGTFNIAPVCRFKQLLVVHFSHENQIYPFIYILLSNKSMLTYKHILHFIEVNLFQFKPTSFAVDFEEALRNSLQLVFPTVKVTTCWFHFCQDLRITASKIPNFIAALYKNKEAYLLYRQFLILPLLNPEDIYLAFDFLNAKANEKTFIKKGESIFKHFLTYFKKQWIEKETPSAISIFGTDLRITSAIENFNSHLSKRFSKAGCFWKSIDVLLVEDQVKSKEFSQLVLDLFKPPKKILMGKQIFIEKMLHKLDKKTISIEDFLNKMGNTNKVLSEKSARLEFWQGDDDETVDCDQDVWLGQNIVDDKSNHSVILCEITGKVLLQPCIHTKNNNF